MVGNAHHLYGLVLGLLLGYPGFANFWCLFIFGLTKSAFKD